MVLKVILDVRQKIKMEKKSEEKNLVRNYILDSRHFHLKISIQDILVLIHGRQRMNI